MPPLRRVPALDRGLMVEPMAPRISSCAVRTGAACSRQVLEHAERATRTIAPPTTPAVSRSGRTRADTPVRNDRFGDGQKLGQNFGEDENDRGHCDCRNGNAVAVEHLQGD